MSDQQLDCALDLMRRLPPQQIEKNLSDLIDLVPSLCEDLLSSVDQPLKIARDKVVGKDYLLCDYNRDGDSYRSPWSNKYDPPLEDGAMPSARLRKLEVEANNAFDQYRDLCSLDGIDLALPSQGFSAELKRRTEEKSQRRAGGCGRRSSQGMGEAAEVAPQDMENKIRSTLNEIYFGKTKDIVNGLRSVQTFADKSKQEALKNDLVEALKRKQQC
ncbi:Hypothetical predicted protein [Marmota monax]|uniref:F-actin-capping protein subunit beta n=1 Tax=Marmota monax TaxID=9995 RepID=A0A5E4A1M4_MARMO|nr:Hypothetical predicted protein [Marmota monax]